MESVKQMELFPNANEEDIQSARSLLNRYVRIRKTVDILDNRLEMSQKEKQVCGEYQLKAQAVEIAVSLIIDDNIRTVMEFRFIRGNSRWGTVKRFNSITDRSIDRRIARGIKSVAETLKLLEIL